MLMYRVAQNIKEGIEGHPASWYSDVFSLVFESLDREGANQLWKKELAKPPRDDNDGRAGEHSEDDFQ